jgi:hypothetical protein
MWQISSIWEQQNQIKTAMTKKLRENYIWRMLATIHLRVPCFPISSLKLKVYNIQNHTLAVALYGCET